MSDEFNQALDDSAPTCPSCLRQRHIAGDTGDLFWLCDCGITPIESEPGAGAPPR